MAETIATIDQKTFPVKVDYDISAREAIERGGYEFVDRHLSPFPLEQEKTGVVQLEIKLFSQKGITAEQAGEALDQTKYRPADMHELMAFGEQHPDIQFQFAIISPAIHFTRERTRGISDHIPALSCGGFKGTRRNLISVTPSHDMNGREWMMAAVLI